MNTLRIDHSSSRRHNKGGQRSSPEYEQRSPQSQYQQDPQNYDHSHLILNTVLPPSPPQVWTMFFPDSPPRSPLLSSSSSSSAYPPSSSSSSSSSPSPSSPSSPSLGTVSDEEEIIAFLLSNLEDDAAYVENDLHVLRYTLEDLTTSEYTPASVQSRTLQILGEIENADHDLPNLRKRLEEISTELEALDCDEITRELQKQYVVIDKTLTAADEMRKELRVWADAIYFTAHDLERLMEAAKS